MESKIKGENRTGNKIILKTKYANKIVIESFEKKDKFLSLHFNLAIDSIKFNSIFSYSKEQLPYIAMWGSLRKKMVLKCPYDVWISDLDYPELNKNKINKTKKMNIYIDMTLINKWDDKWLKEIDKNLIEKYVEECYWLVYNKMVEII